MIQDSPTASEHNNSFHTTGFLIHNADFPNNDNCFNVNNTNCGDVSNSTVTDDQSEILTCLSSLQHRSWHYDVLMRRVDNMGY